MILSLLAGFALAHPDQGRAADVAALTHIKEVDWNGYYRRRDVDGLDAFLDDRFIHFTSDGSIEAKQDALDYVRDNEWRGASNNFAYKVTDIQFYGADYANVFGIGSFDTAECRRHYVSSNVLKRGDDGWHAMFSHSSPSFCPDGEIDADRLSDEANVQATLSAVYAVISGPVGEDRDFDAMRALFTDDARLALVDSRGISGGNLERYIERSGTFLRDTGFTERELNRRIEIFGHLAHAWSSYAGAFTRDGVEQTIRGINSFQLAKQADGSWKVYSIFWQHEEPGLTLPADMAGEGGE